MWEKLSAPWQAALEMAWEAYCAGTVPIGAAVADKNGNILSRGRNRILDKSAPGKQIYGDMLAHAEVNALFALELDQESRHDAIIYTTVEPCPLCMGAIYMSSIRTIKFASRDPYAGSTNLIGTTPYLSRKPVHAIGPEDTKLESVIIALGAEAEIRFNEERTKTANFFREWREMSPEAVEFGHELYRSGKLAGFVAEKKPAGEVFEYLYNL